MAFITGNQRDPLSQGRFKKRGIPWVWKSRNRHIANHWQGFVPEIIHEACRIRRHDKASQLFPMEYIFVFLKDTLIHNRHDDSGTD